MRNLSKSKPALLATYESEMASMYLTIKSVLTSQDKVKFHESKFSVLATFT